MDKIVRQCFPVAYRVIDRFHVQKLTFEAVQEIRIKYRWQTLDQENQAIEAAKTSRKACKPEVLENGDTIKQLLARRRYLLFKHKWTKSQVIRARLLFEKYPVISRAYIYP